MSQIVSQTPPWVFGLFVGLLVLGLMQTRNRKVREWLAYLLPVGMVCLSLSGVHTSFGLQAIPILAWAFGIAVVTLLGSKAMANNGVVYLSQERSFLIPGSWIPLLVIMAIFFVKYVFAVLKSVGVIDVTSTTTAVLFSLIYGCLSGYFSARATTLVAAREKPADANSDAARATTA